MALDFLIPAFLIVVIQSIKHRNIKVAAAFMAIGSLLIHFSYKYFIFPGTGGLDPIYNDEIYFLNFDLGLCRWREIFSNLFVLSAGQSAPFACAVQYLGQWMTNDALMFRLANYTMIAMTISFLLSQRKHFPEHARTIVLACYFLVLSPTVFFFSTKVLRDTLIMFLVTVSFIFYFKKQHVLTLLTLGPLFVLRRHLAVAMALGYLISFVRISPMSAAFVSLCVAGLFSFFQIAPFGSFIENFDEFFVSLPFSMSGLHILVADPIQFNVSFERVILQRLLAPDTFLPLVIINIFAIIPFNRASLYVRIVCFLFPTLVWYNYFYFESKFTAVRQTVLPFLPLLFLALSDLMFRNRWLQRRMGEQIGV
jgi:hypothetical protein